MNSKNSAQESGDVSVEYLEQVNDKDGAKKSAHTSASEGVRNHGDPAPKRDGSQYLVDDSGLECIGSENVTQSPPTEVDSPPSQRETSPSTPSKGLKRRRPPVPGMSFPQSEDVHRFPPPSASKKVRWHTEPVRLLQPRKTPEEKLAAGSIHEIHLKPLVNDIFHSKLAMGKYAELGKFLFPEVREYMTVYLSVKLHQILGDAKTWASKVTREHPVEGDLMRALIARQFHHE